MDSIDLGRNLIFAHSENKKTPTGNPIGAELGARGESLLGVRVRVLAFLADLVGRRLPA